MVNKYLIIIIGVLFCCCLLFYNLWDNTKAELKSAKEYNKTLESEIKRRDENEKNLSKKLTELSKLYDSNPDWANTRLPDNVIVWLRKSCKACQ